MYITPTLNDSEPTSKPRAIAVLTSGGDCPGMNPAIRGVVRAALHKGIKVFGVQRGYSGLIIGDMQEMDSSSVSNIVQRGGTFLKSDRCPAFKDPAVRYQAAEVLKEKGIDAVVVIGGDGSLTGAHLLTSENDIRVIGLPGTIDNDIYGTDLTIGFDTAVNTAVEAIDRIRDTALSHESLFLVEVMGRNSGFIATHVGIACGAEMIIIPEYELQIDAICFQLVNNRLQGKSSSGIIVVAEGPKPGVTTNIAKQLNQQELDPKVCILGHIQRGGSPSGHDRVLASCLGTSAVDYLCAGYNDVMIGVQNGKIKETPLHQIIENNKQLDNQLFERALMLHK
ncbi:MULTISPECIES: 6-phosphofructokinase [unclassified Neptuniibacter]|uniref:6-phosphofructokinase n=1 Tax=unclassified Neptuniibacter TaxID=2630693 RepID=UPI000C5662C6|nr:MULTISPECIES: 6-phosphofructokinase [unclassified Neptuniibacter]MAY42166.1 6-phosphofructokinase [Oceanospirillaceae bacterium]|tara:strand:+ start:293 stop:1306 length:1014 start_codon:yes stop_codon:yes gene_type:complete